MFSNVVLASSVQKHGSAHSIPMPVIVQLIICFAVSLFHTLLKCFMHDLHLFSEMFDHLYYFYSQFIFSDTFYFLFNYVLCYFTLFLCLQHILYCLHICLSHYVNGLFFLGYRVVVLASSLCSEWVSVVQWLCVLGGSGPGNYIPVATA